MSDERPMRSASPYRRVLLALALLALPAAAGASDWNWNLTPYLWYLDATLDVTVNDREIFGTTVEADDLLDDADFAIMLHFEGRRGKVGVFADLLVADLGDEQRNIAVGPIPITAEADPELTILDVGGVWHPGDEENGFGVRYGLRLIDLDQELDVQLVGQLSTNRRLYELARTEIDGLVGLRYLTELSESWSFAAAADVSAGGSDGSWTAWLVFGYHWGSNDQYAVRFGYKHQELEIGDEDRTATVETNLELSGPVVGFTFGF